MTARVPWVAAKNPFDAHPAARERAVSGDRLAGVMRTCGGKAAGRRKQRADEVLIAPNRRNNQRDQQFPHFACMPRSSRARASAPSLAVFLSNCLRTRTMTLTAQDLPAPLAGNARLKPSLTRRFAKFLDTARGATFLLTATPNREIPARFGRAYTTNHSLLETPAPGEKSKPSRRPIRRYRGRDCPDVEFPAPAWSMRCFRGRRARGPWRGAP